MLKSRVFAALICALPGLAVAAGNLSYGPDKGQVQQMLEISDAAVRLSAQGRAQWLLYLDQSQTVYLVDDRKRSYSKLTREAAQQLNQQVSAMQKKIEATLALLPPEQRAMMQSMLPPVPELASVQSYRVEAAGPSKTLGRWSCKPFVVMADDQPKDELCVAEIEAVGLANADFELLKRLSETLSGLAEQFGMASMTAVMDRLDGLPVAYGEVGAKPRSLLLRAGQEAPRPERMQLPAEYSEQSLLAGMIP